MAREKHWSKVGPLIFTADGGTEGNLQVADTENLFVKQAIILKSSTTERVDLEIKRILSKTLIKVGPKGQNINAFADISAFLVSEIATIRVHEQTSSRVPPEVIIQSKFAGEPISADRMIDVDYSGDFYTRNNPAPTQDAETAALVNLTVLGLLGIPLDDFVIADDELVILNDGTLVKAGP